MLRTPAFLSAFPTSTWAGLPAAAAAAGQIFRATDVGISGVGIVVISDGTRWVPLGPQLLDRSAVAVSTTGDTNENVLRTVTIPAGAMGLNGGLDIRAVWSVTNSANLKNLKARFGGVGGTAHFQLATNNNPAVVDLRRTIRNRNSASSQVGQAASPLVGNSTTAVVTSAIDTSVAQTLVFTGQNGLAAETITLEVSETWLLP